MGRMRQVYPYIMKLDYDNTRTRSVTSIDGASDVEKKSPQEHFAEFYEMQNNQPMSEQQSDFILKLIEQVWEGEK